jgi:glyoxylase-like metal-dependent hydrolase (beta-lactamase superfamily II)
VVFESKERESQMNASYRFRVGKLECIAVADGSNSYEANLLFANASEKKLQQALEEHSLGIELDIPYTCLVVKVNAEWVLVDTGAGMREDAQVGRLVQNLAAEGIDPADIKVVILTHGHTDHIGGLTNEEGELRFGEARYVMGKREWGFWRSRESLKELGWESIIPFMEKNLGAIEERVELIEREREILPGLRVIPAEGHTPGHIVVVFSSEGEELWSTGDALIHPVHFEHLGWHTVYDLAPEEAVETKRRILGEVDKGVIVHAYHFPFPGIGQVIGGDEGWKWQPIGESE